MKPQVTIATYNVLAAAYVRPEYYPGVPAEVFPAEVRYPRVVERIAGLGADVICLQEVDYALFVMAEKRLRALGYEGRWAHKGMGKPDGCAMFVGPDCEHGEWRISVFEDAGADGKASGHVALQTVVTCGNQHVAVATSHFKWMPADTDPDTHVGCVQAAELQDLLERNWSSRLGTVICGDFNALPGSPLLGLFGESGYADAHDASVATFVADGKPQKLDYLMYAGTLRAEPHPTPDITEIGPLPSEDEPSDHLPLIATFVAR